MDRRRRTAAQVEEINKAVQILVGHEIAEITVVEHFDKVVLRGLAVDTKDRDHAKAFAFCLD